MRFSRSSGILLHVTSLPNEFGIGDLGDGAYQFIDFLKSAGQSIWQVLPLSPPSFGDSPYSSYSAFASSEYLISPKSLVRTGLLQQSDLAGVELPAQEHVDYGAAKTLKEPLLRKAFSNFMAADDADAKAQFEDFCEENHWWLEDFARFTALTKHFGHSNWSQWEGDLARHEPAALAHWDGILKPEIAYAKFLQFEFHNQWHTLKAYANENGVQIFGDMPIFVGYESADVWAHQDLFFLDEDGRQTVVAGVPPDYFSETGQRWGNPLYRWDRIAQTGFDWWIKRFRCAFDNFDLLRIDHFRGFESYWEVKAECPTAIDGEWKPGPGAAPFLAAQAELGELPIIAEDLGLITDDVHALRDELGFPGMRVFQFGFDHAHDPYHRPEAYPENSAAYTGTHDNDTTMGWYSQRKQERDEDVLLDEVISRDSPSTHLDMVRSVFGSASVIAIAPMQDVLGLGSDARMNTPGEACGNWTWRCPLTAFSTDVAGQVHEITESTDRLARCPEVVGS